MAATLPRTLIVDDDPVLLEALPETVRLRMPEVVVETADCAAAADHDVIVTDLVMPGMSGADPYFQDKSRSGADADDSHVRESESQGYAIRTRAYAFIQKPIDREYFIASLRRAIRYSRLSKRIDGRILHVKSHLDDLAELQRCVAKHAAAVRGHYPGGKSIISLSESATSTPSHRS